MGPGRYEIYILIGFALFVYACLLINSANKARTEARNRKVEVAPDPNVLNFTCPNCSFQKQLDARAEGRKAACPSCGSVVLISSDPFSEPQTGNQGIILLSESVKMKMKYKAAALALVYGSLGLHKFLLGYTRAGCITLLLCFVSAFLAEQLGDGILLALPLLSLMEAVIYLVKPNEQFYQIYVLNTREWF
jgi:TM2 domain-containing membrane protein YozV